RALSGRADDPPDVAPFFLLRRFVEAIVDRLVRSTAAERAAASPALDSAHDRWLHALSTPDGTIEGPSAEVTRLAREVREWQRPVAAAAAAPFRLTLRLEEPSMPDERASGNGGGAWHVRYLLQSVHDPSLLVSADDVWRDRARRALRHEGFDPKQHLLGSLGQAARLEPRSRERPG